MTTQTTQFTRTSGDKIIAGVCGGIARYFAIDPAIVRLVFVLAVFLGGASPLIYLVLWLIMPLDQNVSSVPSTITTTATPSLPAIPDHPRPVEEWKYDPYTGERIQKQ